MKRWIVNGLMVMGVTGLVSMAGGAGAAEHGGQEHGGTTTAPRAGSGTAAPQAQEHGGQAVKAEPSAAQIRQAIESHVKGIEARDGALEIEDELTGATRKLTFVRVHDRVGKTGDLYYSCTDMRDTATGELLDLDFDVDAADGHLHVVDTRLHKVAGQARYTYDEHDNRIPVSSTGSASTSGQERAY
ncbi:MAG: hypothetical protein HYT90_02190 [Candidatus Omnitrophica bacterium]|nr:hypothetical protein [Candidatus Omnitrophota bacterium]